MKLYEIYEEFEKGKKIRHKDWQEKKYLHKNKDHMMATCVLVCEALSDDWELFEEEKHTDQLLSRQYDLYEMDIKFKNLNERIEKLENYITVCDVLNRLIKLEDEIKNQDFSIELKHKVTRANIVKLEKRISEIEDAK